MQQSSGRTRPTAAAATTRPAPSTVAVQFLAASTSTISSPAAASAGRLSRFDRRGGPMNALPAKGKAPQSDRCNVRTFGMPERCCAWQRQQRQQPAHLNAAAAGCLLSPSAPSCPESPRPHVYTSRPLRCSATLHGAHAAHVRAVYSMHGQVELQTVFVVSRTHHHRHAHTHEHQAHTTLRAHPRGTSSRCCAGRPAARGLSGRQAGEGGGAHCQRYAPVIGAGSDTGDADKPRAVSETVILLALPHRLY